MAIHNHPPVFAVFPGQGSQCVGMGKDFYEAFAIARETFEEVSDAIRLDLKQLCFSGPDSDLILTQNTQPALLCTSVAIYRVIESELNWQPYLVAGHSLGEYSALVASGALNLSTAARWVRERGLAMQQAVPPGQGRMAAILGLEDQQVEKLCQSATHLAAENRRSNPDSEWTAKPIVQPANFNAPGQVVIAGSSDAVDAAIHLLKSGSDFGKGKAIPLSVSAPFHCELMGPAREKMAQLFTNSKPEEKPKAPRCAYLPNRTARPTQETGVILELLVQQIDHPVLWKQSIEAVFQGNSVAAVIECGPGKVLTGLIKRTIPALPNDFPLLSVNQVDGLQAVENFFSKGMTRV